MVARNDITGDAIQTRGVSDSYRNNYDLIFGKKKVKSDTLQSEDSNQSPNVVNQTDATE